MMEFFITTVCPGASRSGRYERLHSSLDADGMFKFRILDSYGVPCAYGFSKSRTKADAVMVLDSVGSEYGGSQVEFFNPQTQEFECS